LTLNVAVAAVKFDPVIFTLVPPEINPVAGVTAVIVGAGGMKRNPVAFVPVPPASLTVTLTLPRA
jgi:hypothetical protein